MAFSVPRGVQALVSVQCVPGHEHSTTSLLERMHTVLRSRQMYWTDCGVRWGPQHADLWARCLVRIGPDPHTFDDFQTARDAVEKAIEPFCREVVR